MGGEEESDTDDVKGFTDENAAWLRPSGKKRKLPLGGSDDEDEDESGGDEGESDDEEDDEEEVEEKSDDEDSDEEEEVEGDEEEMSVEKKARRLDQKQKKMLKESDAELKMNLAETEKFILPSGKTSAIIRMEAS